LALGWAWGLPGTKPEGKLKKMKIGR
jgi:hypothetical protein